MKAATSRLGDVRSAGPDSMLAMSPTIRPCSDADFDALLEVVNAAATAYAGVIPPDRYGEPYMPADELRGELPPVCGSGGRSTTAG